MRRSSSIRRAFTPWSTRAINGTKWEWRLATEKRRLLKTEFVLLEIADGLAVVPYRV